MVFLLVQGFKGKSVGNVLLNENFHPSSKFYVHAGKMSTNVRSIFMQFT